MVFILQLKLTITRLLIWENERGKHIKLSSRQSKISISKAGWSSVSQLEFREAFTGSA